MPKLIRLKGDASQNQNEIRVSFADTLSIEPGSRIAVRNAYADILDDTPIERFELITPVPLSYKVGAGADQTFIVPNGEYESGRTLTDAIELEINRTGDGTDDYLGIHHTVDVETSGFLKLTTYKASLSDANFDTEWDNIGSGTATLAANSITGLNVPDTVQLFLPHPVPLVGSRFSLTLDANVGQPFQISMSSETGIMFTFASDGSDYTLLDTAGSVYTSVNPPTLNDSIVIDKFGLTVRVTINGSEILTGTAENLDFSAFWDVLLPPNSTVELGNCKCTYLEALGALYGDLFASVTLSLVTPTSPVSKLLVKYLGLTGSIFKYSGTPAVLNGSTQIQGSPGFPGILITIDGLELESYLGTQNSRGTLSNVLDVIMQDQTDLSKIRYQPNEMLPLQMRNARTESIRDMTVRFERDGDTNPLAFDGTPVVTLVIYGPDEQ